MIETGRASSAVSAIHNSRVTCTTRLVDHFWICVHSELRVSRLERNASGFSTRRTCLRIS